ncbi:Peptidase M16 inactive domain-containing protein [Modicisalibacter ilicicola DSM 19980]|uniref:Peptidase M16 inactive domain-containing protein n=1 Tax=Modicisalibacter ilicicola DSM 19980 TaxID=1121942 RepID=A0A1M5AZ77_9GAMM|nr:insulinase family protein [Halomonas ilicicola]SHF35466.1 Peptidase M16 inactive domain-containing protein [Halomonas ilicicola DSM 19980]
MTDQAEVPGLPAGNRLAERRLANGVRTLAIEVPTARQVRLVAAVGVGYLDEPETLPGLAHLLEHALFLGSPGHPQPGDFAAWVGEQGGRYNAHTGEQATDVHLTLPPDAGQAGLTRLLDLVLRPCLREMLIAREVEVIEAEFRARLSDPELHRQRARSRLYRPSHPAFRCHHGHRQSLGNDLPALLAALRTFHAQHYHAERLSLVMLGPEPVDRQLALLAAAGEIPGDTAGPPAILPAHPWRWAEPARVQWSLPEGQPTATPVLEMIWPLPDPLTPEQRWVGEQLAQALADGKLAATLQPHLALLDLEAHLSTESGAALGLTLTLREEPSSRHVETLLATCQSHLQRLVTRFATEPPGPSSSALHDLDAWPRQLACRLATGQPARPSPPNSAAAAEATVELEGWLVPERCRVLEALPTPARLHESIAETGTRFCRCPPGPFSAAWPVRPAPPLAPHRLQQDSAPVAPGTILDDEALLVWWGGGPPPADAFWGLAWPAPMADQPARLIEWRRRTLALRQTAQALGLHLSLGGDGRGDWLLATGDAARLESCLAQGLAAWPTTPDLAPSLPSPGLLAQRLLALLDTLAAPRRDDDSRIIAWAGGTLGAAQTLAGSRRLSEGFAGSSTPDLPSPEATSQALEPEGQPIRWLPPQGGDRAVMLQVDARDDSPTSRALFQLLAQCHDAAFQQALRQHQGLGYVAAVRYREGSGWPRLGYVVQSPHADINVLKHAVSDFLARQGVMLAALDAAVFERRRAGLASAWGPPETPGEAMARAWQGVRRNGDPAPWLLAREALAGLTVERLIAQATALVEGRLTWQWWAHSPVGLGSSEIRDQL